MAYVWDTIYKMRGFISFTLVFSLIIAFILLILTSMVNWKKKTMKVAGLFLDLSVRGIALLAVCFIQFCMVTYMLVFGAQPNKLYNTAFFVIFIAVAILYGPKKVVIDHFLNMVLLYAGLTTEYVVVGYMRDVHFEWPVVIMAAALGFFILSCNCFFFLKDVYSLAEGKWRTKYEFRDKS